MRSVVTLLFAVAVVLVQAVVVNRLPFGVFSVPGPDLAVAAVVALALTTGPAAAAGWGFGIGLALDALPPAEHEMGRYALVLCLAGYLVSLLHRNTGAPGTRLSGPFALGAVLGASFGVGLAYAGLGVLMGDPRTGPADIAVAVGVGAGLTLAAAPLVVLPIIRLREALSDHEFATVQGPMSPRGW